MCWARNAVGEQQQPCHFQVVPAGQPDPLTDCIATNITTEAVHITCLPGYDGGLPQQFQVVVIDMSNGRSVFNGTETMSKFVIGNLAASRTYELIIWAFNNKGRSDPQIVHLTTAAVHQLTLTDKDKGIEPVGKPIEIEFPAMVDWTFKTIFFGYDSGIKCDCSGCIAAFLSTGLGGTYRFPPAGRITAIGPYSWFHHRNRICLNHRRSHHNTNHASSREESSWPSTSPTASQTSSRRRVRKSGRSIAHQPGRNCRLDVKETSNDTRRRYNFL